MDRNEQKQSKSDSLENLPEQKNAKDQQQQQQPTPEQEEGVKGGVAAKRPDWFGRA